MVSTGGSALRFYLLALAQADRLIARGAPGIAHYDPAKYYEALVFGSDAVLKLCVPGKKVPSKVQQ